MFVDQLRGESMNKNTNNSPDSRKMEIWDALKDVDPAHTKTVEFGRKFTSIDSQYKIQRMTERFGACGEGWGYKTYDQTITAGHYVLVKVSVTLWWRGKDDYMMEFGPVTSCCELVRPSMSGKRSDKRTDYDEQGNAVLQIDTDAYKKAMTDALTKAMSHVGLGASVFLGLFDDDKYVHAMRVKFDEEGATVRRAKAAINSARDMDKIAKTKEWITELITSDAIGAEVYDTLMAACDERAGELVQEDSK
jgi:hypothetical protein